VILSRATVSTVSCRPTGSGISSTVKVCRALSSFHPVDEVPAAFGHGGHVPCQFLTDLVPRRGVAVLRVKAPFEVNP
jgi:hypothetical protein